jgi:precorrin-6B methylase 2
MNMVRRNAQQTGTHPTIHDKGAQHTYSKNENKVSVCVGGGGNRTEFSQRQIAFLKDQSQLTVQNQSALRNFGLENYFGIRF